MEINPNKSTPRLNRPQPAKRVSRSEKTDTVSSGDKDVLEAASFTTLEEAFSALPEVRQERVEDGRRLARDPEYPDDRQLRDVSRLVYRSLAGERNPKEAGEDGI